MSTQIPEAVYSKYRIHGVGWIVGAILVVGGAVVSAWVAPAQDLTYVGNGSLAQETFNTALFVAFLGMAAVVAAMTIIGAHLAEAITGLQLEERRAAHVILDQTKPG